MIDLELPLGKRTPLYRFFEIVPAVLSYGAILLLIILSLVNPLLAAIYLLIVILTAFVKSFGIAFNTIRGHRQLIKAQQVDWHARVQELEDPAASYQQRESTHSSGFGYRNHIDNLRQMAADPSSYPKPSQLFHMVIIATYNESYDVLQPTIESVKTSTVDSDRVIICLAYEERGGPEIQKTVQRLQREYKDTFYGFQIIQHPDGLPDEVVGKGANITYAAHIMEQWCDERNLSYKDIIITTLDSDNRPYHTYFDYVTYEYIVQPDRKYLSYQPIALYFGNIWDAPAPMRVIATGNSFWTVISSMRPHTLRNFAAHSQPMEALSEMGYWSKRSIVEDGHQYWRSYFYFSGNYSVIPIHVPIYQDAVMADTLWKTMVAQFKQLRRWGYGVSDIPYVATRLFSRERTVPLGGGFARLARLVDSHITLATTAIMVSFGGWIPLLVNPEASRNIAAHSLPEVVSLIQRIAMVGIFITILLMLKMLPPRPSRYKRHRTIWMVLQWFLMPLTSIGYGSTAAFNAQTHLMLGKYLDKFDVTEKATVASRQRTKDNKKRR